MKIAVSYHIRNYKRKTNQQSWSKDSRKKALHALKNGTSASKEFQILKTTLRRRFKDQNKHAKNHTKILGNYKVNLI